MKPLHFTGLFFLITTSLFSSIDAKSQQSKILGTWMNNQFGYEMGLQLNADGSGTFDGEPITFKSTSTTLTITTQGQTINYNYDLDENDLIVSGGDLEQAITFKRTGDLPNAKTVPTKGQSKRTIPNANSNAKLIGIWSGYGETIEFKSDGQCVYQGHQYPYTVSLVSIFIQTNEGVLTIGYAVNGQQLNLTVNGQNLFYTKGKIDAANSQQSKGGKIDGTMVGKWCYVNVTTTNSGGVSSDECFTLNADGTYQYYSERSMSANTNAFSSGTSSQNSDQGTWWVDGNRIYYSSQTKGQGSYLLEKRNHPKTGDPMLVIEGTSYVTFYNKSPW